MDIYKLTDFGDQEIIIGSRAYYSRKNNMRLVKSDWLSSVGNKISASLRFKTKYGFDEFAFLEKYGLRAVQFGNWMDYGNRADHFLALVEALDHLDEILNTSNIGWYKKLSVSIGARGRGTALAHFEPRRNAINLTKTKGGHSFAHEYGHAIDFIGGEYFSKSADSYAISNAKATRTAEKNASVDEVRNLMNIVLDGVRKGERYEKLAKWATEHGTFAYWCCNTEIWARTFAQWVALECKNKNIEDKVLCKEIDDGSVVNIPVNELKKLSPYIRKLVNLCVAFLEGVISKPPKATTKNPFLKKEKTKPAAPKKAAGKQLNLFSRK